MVRQVLSDVQIAALYDELEKIAIAKESGLFENIARKLQNPATWTKARQTIQRPFDVGELRRSKGWGPEVYQKQFDKVLKREGPDYAARVAEKANFVPYLKRTRWGQGKRDAGPVSAVQELLQQRKAVKSLPATRPSVAPAALPQVTR